MTCIRCPYTGIAQCEGPCGVCPEGSCMAEMNGAEELELNDETFAENEGVSGI